MKKSIIILVLFLCTASTQAYCQQHKKIDTTSSVKNIYTSLFKQVLKGQGLDNKAVEMAYVDFPPGVHRLRTVILARCLYMY